MITPIASELQILAKDSVPLWFFDESKGMRVEEGIAKKEGNTFVGEVNHFSCWSYDETLDFITVKGRLIDSKTLNPIIRAPFYVRASLYNNTPMKNANVTISSSIVNMSLAIKDGVYSLSKICACENIETTLIVRNYNVSGEITKKVILKLGNNLIPDIQICGSIIDFNYFRYEIDGMKTLIDSDQVADFIFGNIFSVSEGDSSTNGSGFLLTWKGNHYEIGTFSIEKGAIMGSKVQSSWESFDVIGTVTKTELVYYEQYLKKNKGTFISLSTDPFSGKEHNIKEEFLYSRKNISPS